jgi:hypothetical protein
MNVDLNSFFVRLYLRFTVAFLVAAIAEPIAAAPTLPAFPKELRAFGELVFQKMAQRQVPAGVHFWQNQCTETTQDPNFEADVCSIDLNDDGLKELVVLSHCKKSNRFDIYEQRNSRWVQIAVMGCDEIVLLARHNRYYQIEGRCIGGHGETLSRQLFVFKAPRFHLRRFDIYEHDTYVRSGDTRQMEEVLEHDYREQFK